MIKPAQIPSKIPLFAEEITGKCEKKSGKRREIKREKARNKTGDCENFRENFQDIARKKQDTSGKMEKKFRE